MRNKGQIKDKIENVHKKKSANLVSTWFAD